jgi:hypothetical protein
LARAVAAKMFYDRMVLLLRQFAWKAIETMRTLFSSVILMLLRSVIDAVTERVVESSPRQSDGVQGLR